MPVFKAGELLYYSNRQICMNSLSFPELLNKTRLSASFSSINDAVKNRKFPIDIEGCEGSLTSLIIADICLSNKPQAKYKTGWITGHEQPAVNQIFIVAPHEDAADELIQDLAGLNGDTQSVSCIKFPWWGTAPYRELTPQAAVFGERVKVISRLAFKQNTPEKPQIVIIPQRALLFPLPPCNYILNLLVTLKPDCLFDTAVISKLLVSYGYTKVPRVTLQGEFSMRGEVLDIFMGGDEHAYRVLFDFNKVETIKKFDPVMQMTKTDRLAELTIRPMKEVVWTDDRIEILEKNLSACKEFPDGGKSIIDELTTKRFIKGEEMFFPLAFEKAGCLLDYLLTDSQDIQNILLLIDRERLDNSHESIMKDYHGLYSKMMREKKQYSQQTDGINYPMPERLVLNFSDMLDSFQNRSKAVISLRSIKGEPQSGVHHIELACEPARSFFGNIKYLRDEFDTLLLNGWKIAVAAESEVQADRIALILETPAESQKSLSIMSVPLTAGFSLPDIKLMVIQENEIFGRRKRAPRSLKTARSSPIDTFVEINPGDYIVHVNHGIGLFKGIERLTSAGHERDYIKIEYSGEETVFVPVEQLNLVQRYIGHEGQSPRLDTIGSKSWESRKNNVKKSVEDIAEKLIELYSKRKKARGYAFAKDSEWQTMFEAAFAFDETEDQLRCIDEIKKDMESVSPMDRLVCGDVGYGKTEVALRACFKAVMDGKQAVFLAPTTILVEQHHENIKERFSKFPVNTAMLSRFVDRKKTRIILEKLKNGEIDLVVGTHRVIQRDVAFKNLGLIVIDEEQRFGVKDKERLKELKTNVDCLTLSATPIPRTLHMSLVKIRDMSLLATAPPGRHPIETFVEEYDNYLIAKAIRREVERGGQVFFLHNRIDSLKDTRQKLERLLPEILIDSAHGQMDANDLEDVMRRFIHGAFHVLVSTTIIENGIDIPNVNTIIIDRADMYGVSQLYQLRGRVGRSDRVAYAYLFYPEQKALSEIAMKRLQTISDFTELGSGFKIAMKDMEIRGAGNLLGREQSGDIYSVGFDLYIKLLEEAVRKLEESDYEEETETLLELEYSGFIPDSYIDSPQSKMEVYKIIAAIRNKDDLERVWTELLDRFGPLPDEAASLLSLAEIRIICRLLAVSSLKERSGIVRIEFAKVARVKVERLIRLMQESAGKVKLDPKKPNILLLTTGNIGLKEKSEFIREKLYTLL